MSPTAWGVSRRRRSAPWGGGVGGGKFRKQGGGAPPAFPPPAPAGAPPRPPPSLPFFSRGARGVLTGSPLYVPVHLPNGRVNVDLRLHGGGKSTIVSVGRGPCT